MKSIYEMFACDIANKINQEVNKHIEMTLIYGGYYSPSDFDDFEEFVNKSEININITGRDNYDLYFCDELILSWYIKYDDDSVSVEFYGDHGPSSRVVIV